MHFRGGYYTKQLFSGYKHSYSRETVLQSLYEYKLEFSIYETGIGPND